MLPSSVMALPPSENAPAGDKKLMPPNAVPAVKSLVLLKRVVAVNVNTSPATGAVLAFQFAPVFQRLSVPPPSQVFGAAKAESNERPLTSNAPSNSEQKRCERRGLGCVFIIGMKGCR